MPSPSPEVRPRKPARSWRVVLVAFLVVVACGVLGRVAWRAFVRPDRSSHLFEMSFFNGMDPADAATYAARSDTIRARAAADGEDVGLAVVRSVGTEDVSDEEVRAYYLEHVEMFGSRPLQDAEPGIRRILQVRKARERMEGRGLGTTEGVPAAD